MGKRNLTMYLDAAKAMDAAASACLWLEKEAEGDAAVKLVTISNLCRMVAAVARQEFQRRLEKPPEHGTQGAAACESLREVVPADRWRLNETEE